MKYPQLVSSSTPASLQDWLEEELESRGIDGVYTRYILSLLQQDTIDLDPSECEHLSFNGKRIHQIKRKDLDRSKHRRGKSWERQLKRDLCNCTNPWLVDTEKRKKTAAVECLKSASEQKIGIEKLIDEVCTKLKHIQATNAKETLRLITSSPVICLQNSEILESSLQEQTEKYYAAFPALCGKHEPLAKLFPQQEMWTVWDGRKIVHFANEKEALDAAESDPSASDPESDISEKENRNASDTERDALRDGKKDLQVNSKSSPPSFIVPKMKIPIHKVANLSMYSPFTSSAYQVSKSIGTDCKTEYLAERKLFGRDQQPSVEDEIRQQFHVAALPRKLVMETDTWELLASLRASTPFGKTAEDGENQDIQVTDLVSKFDSNLASIWAKADAESVEDLKISDDLEVSLQIFSVKPLEINSEPRKSLENDSASVWAVSLDDFKNMKLQERFGSPFQLASVISIPNLLQSLASNASLVSRKDLMHSANSSFLESEIIIQHDIDTAILSPKLEDNMKTGDFDDVESILFACTDRLFSMSNNEGKSPNSSEYGSISPSDLLVNDSRRFYHLWEENAEQKNCSNIWVNSKSMDKVVSWISSQSDHAPSAVSLSVNGEWKMPFPNNCSPSRENCTITYHKGESRFVEVIPSNKSTHFPVAADVETHSSANFLDVDEGENLLTSPKTHFQPIHQDSSEGESISNEAEIPCEEIVRTPTPEESIPSSLTPEILSPPPGFKRSLGSLDDLVGITELSSLFNKDLDTSRDSELLEIITRGWNPELLKDKSTSTESPCPPIGNDILTFRDNKVWSSGSIEETFSEMGLPWKWSTTDDSNDPWSALHIGQEDELEDDIFEESNVGYLSNGVVRDCNLKALRKELEEEEEELFRDINCLSDSDAEVGCKETLCSETTTYVEKQEPSMPLCEEKPSSCFEMKDWESSGQGLKNGDSISEVEKKELKEKENSTSTFPLVPVDKVLYSSELEDEWRKTSEPFDVQVPKKSKSKAKALSQKRPCTFFLEGNCRRSDCKFSHDLASITCRFWEEGTCFKGITCPFLHGYISDIHPCEENAAANKFILESESDFPSLSKSGTAANSSAKAPSKSTGRIIRPKKKKQSTVDTHKRLDNPDTSSL